MGYFWEGIPPYLLPVIARALGPGTVAVETGTFRGDSAALFADTFGACVTIERSLDLGHQAQQRFAADDRVRVLIGSSRELLKDALPEREISCFIWLDAHGVYDHTADSEENPLMHEIETIATVRDSPNTVIAIDDARGMGTQPGWPPISEICTALDDAGYSVIFLDDTVVAFDSALGLDTYEIYRSSRQTDVPMVFHIWPQIRRVVQGRRMLDTVVSRIRR